MILTDKTAAFLSGEPFLSFETEGLIANSTLLGIVMLLPILAIWAFATFTKPGKQMLERYFSN
ncbi:MAG: hypothetical protein N3G22_03705 [Candidatus Micrarchaeota archaeon]|nr:hypothetical protein [Candidatus Micrarchaeota archaeon]